MAKKRGRECKVCKLERTHPEAFAKIDYQIKNGKPRTMSKFLRYINKEYVINITDMNLNRHRPHLIIEAEFEDLGTTPGSGQNDGQTSTGLNFLSFPDLEPMHEKFLFIYRSNGYKDKKKAYIDAGFKRPKGVYDLLKRPEIIAALNEMRAVDFIQLKVTGNQVIAGLGKVANYTDFIDQMYDDKGRPITNIKLWPEELRCALSAVEMTEDVIGAGDDDELVTKRKFKFRFESHLKAKQELRKHFMEIELYKDKNPDKAHYEKIIEMLLSNKLNPIAAGLELGKLNLDPPEALKIAMRKVDPSILDKPHILDSDNMEEYSDDELDRVIAQEGEK